MGGKGTAVRSRAAKRRGREKDLRDTTTAVKGFSAPESDASRPSTPITRSRFGAGGSPSRPSTPRARYHRSQASQSLHPQNPVQTPQQFYDWFSLIDRSISHNQEAHFRAYLSNVSSHIDTCDGITERVDEVKRDLEDMLESWIRVEEGGMSLKEACEELLDERDRLLQLTDAVGAILEYFQELERATRMLNHPGDSLVLQGDFLDMVERVDICIDFLQHHRHFNEAEVYLLRFRQCLTRAMTLIRMYFVSALKVLTTDVTGRLSDKDISETAKTHLLYTRFETVATEVSPLLHELERRARSHPEELSSLLEECQTAYLSSRRSLLATRLVEEIKGLDPTRTELVELTRAGCSFLRQLCIDEFSLYRQFFTSGKESIYRYLESLCDYLYDDLRPRILHEPRLVVLCKVCTVLQALMVLDVPLTLEPENGVDKESVSEGNYSGPEELGQIHIGQLLQSLLQDAQTRLFFKAQAFVQSDIRNYVPKPADLKYPEHLELSKSNYEMANGEEELPEQLFRQSTLRSREIWYPPLQKLVWVLGQLYEFVQSIIFQDIAQEAVDFCRSNLLTASTMLSSPDEVAPLMDGKLFLVRHLVILKEITHDLNLSQRNSSESLDLLQVTEKLREILRSSSFIPQVVVDSFGRPRETQNLTTVQQKLDYDLKAACEGVIDAVANSVCSNLQMFVVDPPRAVISDASKSVSSSSTAMEVEQEFRTSLQTHLSSALSRMKLYLENDGTIRVLLTHIHSKIVDEYINFRQFALGLPDTASQISFYSSDELRRVLDSHSKSIVT